MQCNFSIDQIKFLKVQTLDPAVRGGVCTGMVMEWLRREMTGEPQEFLFYKNAYQFASRHRAISDQHWATQSCSLSAKSDFYTSVKREPFHSNEFRYRMATVNSGFFLIAIYGSWAPGHSIGLSIKNGIYRIIDPNYGEFETANKQTPPLGAATCQKLIFNYYPLANIPYMQLTELKIK